jgi:hypothetical protein
MARMTLFKEIFPLASTLVKNSRALRAAGLSSGSAAGVTGALLITAAGLGVSAGRGCAAGRGSAAGTCVTVTSGAGAGVAFW